MTDHEPKDPNEPAWSKQRMDPSLSNPIYAECLEIIPCLQESDINKMSKEMILKLSARHIKHATKIAEGAQVHTPTGVRPLRMEDFRQEIDQVLENAPILHSARNAAVRETFAAKRRMTDDKTAHRQDPPVFTTSSNLHFPNFPPARAFSNQLTSHPFLMMSSNSNAPSSSGTVTQSTGLQKICFLQSSPTGWTFVNLVPHLADGRRDFDAMKPYNDDGTPV